MRQKSVTLLQRDANYGLTYAEAGQASCDCQTKPPGRPKYKDQGQEKEIKCCRREVVPPSSSKEPLNKTCTCITHACVPWLEKILVLVERP